MKAYKGQDEQMKTQRQTKRQKSRERWAQLLDEIAGGKGKSNYAKHLRAINRRVDTQKGGKGK